MLSPGIYKRDDKDFLNEIANYLISDFSDDKCTELENEINILIKDIWNKIHMVNSKALLMLSSDIEKMGHFDNFDGTLIAMPQDFPSRPTEYIQSVIASSFENNNHLNDIDNDESLCMEIISKIEELAKLTHIYIISWAHTIKESISDEEDLDVIIEAQLMYMVRGSRYQIFQESYFSPLLLPHDDEFIKLFGINASDVLNGLMKLEEALSQGRIQGMNILGQFFERHQNGELPAPEDLANDEKELLSNAIFESFSVEHYDVTRITGWPESFIEKLSYKPGEAEWFEKDRFQYWPIVSLPIQSKPFICLSGRFYCFDYYTLMDNFYRNLRNVLLESDNDYEQIWQIRQKNASENFVANIFKNLLPGCICHQSNYFFLNGKKKNLIENDIIVCFKDVLLIIEIKAGAFTYAPPITDWDKYVRDFRNLIEKPDHQCAATREYLANFEDCASIFDSIGCKKAEIDMTTVTDIFEISVTIDDINAFSSKAERLKFLNLKSGAISISINDLMVYEDYFDNPFVFLHFLKQRRRASRNKSLAFNDELDHLGMYIERNLYSLVDTDDKECDTIFVLDYRDSLNKYYSHARKHAIYFSKPQQELPEVLSRIIQSKYLSKMVNPVYLTSYLLDFSTKTRKIFASQVQLAFEKIEYNTTPKIVSLIGEPESQLAVRLTCIIEREDFDSIGNIEDYREYTLSIMFANSEQNRNMLILSLDENLNFSQMRFEMLSSDGIEPEDKQRLINDGIERIQRSKRNFYEANKKTGRNEPCPCGSGLKFKKCHGA